MSIGVVRLYLGTAWANTREEARLLAVLDSVPQFLYRIDKVAPEFVTSEIDAAAVRIAMTQSHVALLPLTGEGRDALSVEIDMAHNGFRRRIPVVGVLAQSETAGESVASLDLDRIVPLDYSALICAIQELAEEASAQFRREASKLAATPAAAGKPVVKSEAPSPVRTLPFAEIASALEVLRQTRQLAPKIG